MLYIVTGGCGFIGSHVVAELCEAGEEVMVCDWLGADSKWKNIAKHPVCDVIEPPALLTRLQTLSPESVTVIHMGAISDTTEADVGRLFQQNVRATLDLASWCTLNGSRIIYASSAATYGNGAAGFCDDATPEGLARLKPLNAYGWSKHFVDVQMARRERARRPLPAQWVGLKFFNVYGPNEYHKGQMQSVIAQNVRGIIAGQPIRLFKSDRPDYGHGEQVRDFIYVRDCVQVIRWFLEHEGVSGLFNVGTGRARSWLDLGHSMFAAAQIPAAIEFVDMPETLARKYQYFTQAEITKLRAAGYQRPFTSLEEGVRDYVQRYLMTDDPYR